MNAISRDQLNRLGIYVDPFISTEQFLSTFRKLRPYCSNLELIRIGGSSDGGYLIPNDLEGVLTAFSPGVANTVSFEEDLLQRGISSHLADYSVECPPHNFRAASFTKKFIGGYESDVYTTLEKWVRDRAAPNEDSMLLQMDIEGFEYLTLLCTPVSTLARFRIIVVEFHSIDLWGQADFNPIIETILEKLSSHFYVSHIHPNNAGGVVSISGLSVPRLLEVTFHSRNRTSFLSPVQHLPHQLDEPNSPRIPDVLLPEFLFA